MVSPDPVVVERQYYLDKLGILDDPSLSLSELRDMTGGGASVHSATRVGKTSELDLQDLIKGTVFAPAANGIDDTAVLSAFILKNAGKKISFINGSYKVNGSITLPGGTTIDAQRASFTQLADNTPIFTVSTQDVTVQNGKFYGKVTDYIDTTITYPAAVIRATAGTKNLRFLNSECYGFAGAAIFASAVEGLLVQSCKIVGVGTGGGAGTFIFNPTVSKDNCGIIIDNTSSKIWLIRNDISYTCQGILGGAPLNGVHIIGNEIHDIGGQHGIYLNNTINAFIKSNHINGTQAQGIKVQLSTNGNGDITDILVDGNICENIGDAAIHFPSANTNAECFRRITITNNTIKNSGFGIRTQRAIGFLVSENTIFNVINGGIVLEDVLEGAIQDNRINTCGNQGISLTGSVIVANPIATADVRIYRNRVINPAGLNVGTTEFGIHLAGCTDVRIEENIVSDSLGNMRYGLYIATGTQSETDIINNRLTGATDYGMRGVAGSRVRRFSGNTMLGALGSVLNMPTNVGIVNAKELCGATGDGVTDDTIALQQAAALALVATCTLYVPSGIYKTTGTLVLKTHANLYESTISYNGVGTAIEIGDPVNGVTRMKVSIGRIVNTKKTVVGWAEVAGSIGVRIVDTNKSNLLIKSITQFETGLRVWGQVRGCSYNTILLGELYNNKVNHDTGAAATGWTNQNTYIGGSFNHDPAEGSPAVGTRHVLHQTATSVTDTSLYLNCSFEGAGGSTDYMVESYGKMNTFRDCRWETSGTPKVWWRAGSYGNAIRDGFKPDLIVVTNDGLSSNTVTWPASGDVVEIELPPQVFAAVNGVPVIGAILRNSVFNMVLNDIIATTVEFPDNWHTYDVELTIVHDTASAGSVQWLWRTSFVTDADVLTTPAGGTARTTVVAAQKTLKKQTIETGIPITAGKAVTVNLVYSGGTFANTIGIYSVVLRKRS
jgi:hypothetical protein